MQDDIEHHSRRRLIENEKQVRSQNSRAVDAIKKYFRSDKKAETQAVDFYCECADDDCQETISLSVKDYVKHHARKDRFVVAEGHVIQKIEKVVASNGSYEVVQKFELAA